MIADPDLVAVMAQVDLRELAFSACVDLPTVQAVAAGETPSLPVRLRLTAALEGWA